MAILTKSNYLIGLQCPKYLWVKVHAKENLPEVDLATEFILKQGQKVGELAKQLFSKGIDISTEDFNASIEKTAEFLKKRKPLFEAAFKVDRLYSRADILNPVGKDEWDIIEVKSGTKVKEINLHDLSFQKYCYELAGLKIRHCYLIHLDRDYVKQGEIDIKKLFMKEDVTDDVNEFMQNINGRIEEMLNIIDSVDMPEVTIHVKCNDPYGCPIEECWDFLPEHNVFDFYRMGKSAFELFEQGIMEMKDVPDAYKLTSHQSIQLKCALTGKVHINKEKIKEFLASWEKPFSYLDFETFSTGVPMFDGVRPYDHIPFQYSLHVDGGNLKHYAFLSESGDPRLDFLKSLKENLGDGGSIIVYNQSFEKRILKELALAFPEYKEWIDSVIERIVDLWVPFKNFWYYNPKQKGSGSIKKVLPAVVGKDYSDLEIGDGGTASVAYYNVTYGEVGEELKQKVRRDLLEYCELDTEGMVWIVEKLNDLL